MAYVLGDLQESDGSSGNLVVNYNERVTTSSAGVAKSDGYGDDEPITAKAMAPVKMASWNQEYQRVSELWDSLPRRDRGMLEQLTRDYLHCMGGNREVHRHDIKNIAAFLSGLKDDRQCGAYGLCLVHSVLEKIADFYRIKS